MTQPKEVNLPNYLGFNLSPRFSQLIGRQLISNPTVAILELVKNSYDADAETITVTFDDVKSNNARIIIKDDGDGMTLEDLVTKWMVIGTDNKVKSSYSNKGRRKLGEKGIGRFSVERLAKRTTIKTTTLNSDQLIVLDIDWNKYDNSSEFFNQIAHPVSYLPIEENVKGTTIELEGLRDIWDEQMIANLRKELFLLIPLDIGKLSSSFKSDVKVNLVCNDFPNKSGELQKNLLQYYHARLFGQLFKDGTAELELNLRINKKNKQELGVTYKRKLSKEECNYTCGPVIFEAYAFLRDGRLYRGLDFNKDDITKLLDEYSGIKIYRDDFRVKPYGDPHNDWLQLNLKRVTSPEYRLATNQIIGGVKIGRDDNPGLQDVLSRENLYDTQEFQDLISFVNSIFDYYTYASFVENRNRKKDERDTREELYSKIIESSNKILTGSTELKKEVERGLENFEKKTKTILNNQNNTTSGAIDKEQKEQLVTSLIVDVTSDYQKLSTLIDKLNNEVVNVSEQIQKSEEFEARELQIYRNIASLGISAAQFGHETEKLILNSVLAIKNIRRFNEIKTIINDNLQEELEHLERYLISANQKADFFRGYLMREKQENKSIIDVVEIFRELANSFEKSFTAIDVEVKLIDKTKGVSKLSGYYGDIESIATNLFTNAYKALSQGNDDDKIFTITFQTDNGILFINAVNSGKPIDKEDRLHIFEPLFSTHKHGTGLGLTIIEDTLKNYSGSIILLDEYPLTNFEIQIPLTDEVKENE